VYEHYHIFPHSYIITRKTIQAGRVCSDLIIHTNNLNKQSPVRQIPDAINEIHTGNSENEQRGIH